MGPKIHIDRNWGFIFLECDLSRLDHFVLICKPEEHSNAGVKYVGVASIIPIFRLEAEALRV